MGSERNIYTLIAQSLERARNRLVVDAEFGCYLYVRQTLAA
jgi:hypothetical protein